MGRLLGSRSRQRSRTWVRLGEMETSSERGGRPERRGGEGRVRGEGGIKKKEWDKPSTKILNKAFVAG